MWRREIPHAIGLAIGAAAGAVITAAFTLGLALVRLTDSSDEKGPHHAR